MKISVITPSFNQVQFLPDNLRTVGGQIAADFEHIVIDPGSTDGSLETARATPHIELIAEPDRGQSHGITKGFARAAGDVLTWLNSDDFYPSADVLKRVADAFSRDPGADIVYGRVNFVGEQGEFLRKGFINSNPAALLASFEYQVGIVQPGVFLRRHVFERIGGPSEDYEYCMDYEYWVRIARAGFKWSFVDSILAHHRWWPGMKTSSGRGDSLIEHFKVVARNFGYIHWKWIDRYAEYLATQADGVVHHAIEVNSRKKSELARAAIERFVTQDMLARIGKSSEPPHVETLAYIDEHAPKYHRIVFDGAEMPGAISTHPDPVAQKQVAWHVFDTTVPGEKQAYKSYTVPANFSRHFRADWMADQEAHSRKLLAEARSRRKEQCIVVANGPSLKAANFDIFDRADVILSNFAIIDPKLRRVGTYLTVVNDLVAKQGSIDFNRMTGITRVVPFWLANAINGGHETAFVKATVRPQFETDIDGTFSWRSTVSFFNMQLAYALGYEKVILVGFDHSYQQPKDMREGDAIDQRDDDPNHFDPRYFRGKVWQAADTGNMEKMYLLAREAFEKGGRKIVNATVGGKLEVFAREQLESALGIKDPTVARLPLPTPAVEPSELPRLLVIDMTPMGNGSATGEVKRKLLGDWPADRLLQLAAPGTSRLSVVTKDEGSDFESREVGAGEAERAVMEFAPQIVLYRPVADVPRLHDLAMRLIDRHHDVPLVTWMMDDWPARLQAQDRNRAEAMDRDLRALLARSELRLSICDPMSRAFEQRYGLPFVAFANGVELDDWPPRRLHAPGPMTIRYAGGLADDMNSAAVERVARVVEELAGGGMAISLEINTLPWWLERVASRYKQFAHTRIDARKRSFAAYADWLREADVALIAYNFDEASQRYVRYSMANKMPECLASGATVLAHGPRGLATIDYLEAAGAAVVVADDNDVALRDALCRLQADPGYREAVARKGRDLAFSGHSLDQLRSTLRDRLVSIARSSSTARGKVGPARAAAMSSGTAMPTAPAAGIGSATVARSLAEADASAAERRHRLTLLSEVSRILLGTEGSDDPSLPKSGNEGPVAEALSFLAESDSCRQHYERSWRWVRSRSAAE